MTTRILQIRKGIDYLIQICRDVLKEIDVFIGPSLVFLVSCGHYAFFDNTSSPLFILVGMIGLLLVISLARIGLFVTFIFQLIFLAVVAIEQPHTFLVQLGFLAALAVAFFATFLSLPAENFLPTLLMTRRASPYTLPLGEKAEEVQEVLRQKERLWQQLFDARQEITRLYQKKQGSFLEVQKTHCIEQYNELKDKKGKYLKEEEHLSLCVDNIEPFLEDANEHLSTCLKALKAQYNRYRKLREEEKELSYTLIETLFTFLP